MNKDYIPKKVTTLKTIKTSKNNVTKAKLEEVKHKVRNMFKPSTQDVKAHKS
jgi:hypothetical protein